MILRTDFRKQGRVIILRLKNFRQLILTLNFFEMMSSSFDIVLSPFLHTVDNGFRDYLTNACYLHADRAFQFGDSLGFIFLYSLI